MNEIDQFSKCFSYEKLKEDINDKVLNHRGGHILSCRYLCVDIDDFQSYLDYYGYGKSDSRLVLLAELTCPT